MFSAKRVGVWVFVIVATINSFGCEKKAAENSSSAGTAATASADRCPHEIKPDKCPFCTPKLIETDGFCAEHGVAEALCYQCRPYLKTAFRAKGDWCAEHNVPDSQCVVCHPELKEKMQPGAGHGAPTPQGG